MDKKARKRRVPPLDTVAGARQAESAGTWFFSQHQACGKDLHKLILPAVDNWADTQLLLGFSEAVSSAGSALRVLYGRLTSIRELFQAVTQMPVNQGRVLAIQAAAVESAGERFPHLGNR